MRWEDLRRQLLETPGVREEVERLYPYEEVSLEIANLRGAYDMTQTEFAQLVDMPQSTVARLESGRHNPSVRILKKLAKATGTELVIEFRRPRRRRRAKEGAAAASSLRGARTNKPLAASPADD
jgi:transcriptional regulator with XRE-family HTH domain